MNVCLFVQCFLSSFADLCGCFANLMNHRPLNTSDQTGTAILRETCVARMSGFAIRLEMWNPWIFSLGQVWITVVYTCCTYLCGKMNAWASTERNFTKTLWEKGDCSELCKGKRDRIINHIICQSKKGRICTGSLWPNLLLTEVVDLVLRNSLLP